MTYYIGTIPVSPYLEHFGIKGQKWGDRRFQNEDGSLTAAGRARYGVATGSERRTLENLKRIQSDKRRLARMSFRQRNRLANDIDFYEKRMKGLVRKKNFISRRTDAFRSQKFTDRAKQKATSAAVYQVLRTAIRKAVINESWKPNDVVNLATNTALDAGDRLLISELYNRAVGRY